MKSSTCSSLLLDSDSEEELTRKAVCRRRRLSDSLTDEERTEKVRGCCGSGRPSSAAGVILSTCRAHEVLTRCLLLLRQVPRATQPEPLDYNAVNDDEMLAAVLEMSRQDAALSGPPDDEPTSSPDTGFGDADGQDLSHRPDPLDADKPSTGTRAASRRWIDLLYMYTSGTIRPPLLMPILYCHPGQSAKMVL